MKRKLGLNGKILAKLVFSEIYQNLRERKKKKEKSDKMVISLNRFKLIIANKISFRKSTHLIIDLTLFPSNFTCNIPKKKKKIKLKYLSSNGIMEKQTNVFFFFLTHFSPLPCFLSFPPNTVNLKSWSPTPYARKSRSFNNHNIKEKERKKLI